MGYTIQGPITLLGGDLGNTAHTGVHLCYAHRDLLISGRTYFRKYYNTFIDDADDDHVDRCFSNCPRASSPEPTVST